MMMRIKMLVSLQVILTVILWTSLPTFADHAVQLSTEEQLFLQQHPRIVLGTKHNWESYVFVDDDGAISGIDADILNQINASTGADFQLQTGDWLDIQEKAKNKHLDGLSSIPVHKKYQQYLLFSQPYLSLHKMLLVAKGNPKKIRNKSDLQGKTIAIQRGSLADEAIARRYPQSEIIKVNSTSEMIESVITGRADATVGNGATLYISHKLEMPYLQPAFILEETLRFAFGIRKDWPEAVSILNKGLQALGESERLRIEHKWDASHQNSKVMPIVLTVDERHYLDGKHFIAVCTDPDWMPYEQITTAGVHRGILADFGKLWSQKMGIEMRLIKTKNWSQSLDFMKQHKCDVLSSAQVTEQRKQYMSFTAPFASYPIVVAIRQSELFFDRFEQLLDQDLAIVKGYAIIEILKHKYPEINIIEVDNAVQGLQMVSRDEVFGYIDTVATIGYQCQTHGILNIKVSGVLDETYNMSVAVRNDEPLLLSIFDKVVTSLTEQERYEILNKWIAIKYERSVDYGLYWKVTGLILLLLLLLFYRERFISHYNRKLQRMNRELERLSKTDPLTGVANRHSLAEFFQREIDRKKRYQSSFSVIMLDLDHFKEVNDRYGHNVGDQVLIEVANIISKHIRKNDVIGRWGGEEFIILCPQTGKDGSLRMAESLRLQIEHYVFTDAGKLTASFGVTVYDQNESLESFIKRVDDALYKAKETGRNCVRFH
jgi:polar amino acid transport system substrate-binding protein